MGKLLALLLLVCMYEGRAQNLVANGNFDDRNICLEYHTFCAPEAWFRVPLTPVNVSRGTAGFLMGNRYESVVMENIAHPMIFRSFIYTRILCKLDSGKAYRFKSSFRTDDAGFDHMDVIFFPFEPYRNKQLLSTAKEHYTITKQQQVQQLPGNWISYFFEFTATGKEQYLVIGNFSRDVLSIKKEQRLMPNVTYDIDNISLEPLDVTTHACAEWQINKHKLYLNNNRHTPFNYLDDEPEVQTEEPAEPSKKDTPVTVETVIPDPAVNDTLVIPDVLFKFDKSELNPAFAYRLDTLISKIKNRLFKRIEVLGHTDSFGTDEYNQQLSTNRAITVKKYLIDHLHYADGNIITKGFAATVPVSTNATSVGRQKNRRVEIVLVR
jgi:outer membrane protein OmpA-like peptidoglycan-associated protein